MGRLDGKVAIITGGAFGIGRATVELFAREGAAVAIADRQQAAAEELAASLDRDGRRVIAIETDVADDPSVIALVRQTAERLGRPTILFNNAGVDLGGTVTNTTLDRWHRIMEVNLASVYRCSREVIPHMIEAGGGSIVSTSSVQGLYGFPSYSAYATTKAGIIGFTRQLAVDYARHGIRANAICPGAIDTTLADNTKKLENAFPIQPGPPLSSDQATRPAPLGTGKPEHIAYAALFLASDESAYVTGHSLIVDGGMSARIF